MVVISMLVSFTEQYLSRMLTITVSQDGIQTVKSLGEEASYLLLEADMVSSTQVVCHTSSN